MSREQMLLRFGYYSGLMSRLLHDNSYAERWIGRAQDLTKADYVRETSEIQAKLVAGGFIKADEDPYEMEFGDADRD